MANCLDSIVAETVALTTVVLQNHVALEFILAGKGGVCAFIDEECSTYLLDNSEVICNLFDHI